MGRTDCQSPHEADRVLIALNPNAGRGSAAVRAGELAALLRQGGIVAEILGDLEAIGAATREWHTAGRLRALVAVGGDGTVAELLNRTGVGVPLALLPSGTENLLARYLGIERSPGKVADTILAGGRLRLDAGRANGRLFLLMASCGPDSEVVRRLHARRRGPISHLTWAGPIAATLWRYDYPEIRLQGCSGAEAAELEGGGVPHSAQWFFAFNLPCYAGGFRVAPEADGTDGLLDYCALDCRGPLDVLRYAAAARTGRHLEMAGCQSGRLARVRLESARPISYQLDGDFGGQLPLSIEVVPQRATLLVPNREP